MARADRDEWAKRVQRWQDSGLSAREFASEMGLKAASLSYWKWRLKQESEPQGRRAPKPRRAKPARPRFVEVRPAKLGALVGGVDARLELVLADCVIRVPGGFDDDALRRVLAVVAERA